MKKLMVMAACFLSLNVIQAEVMTLPSKFYVSERFLSLTPTFDIKTKNEKLGLVRRKIFSLMPEYHLKDCDGNTAAIARMRFWSFGAKFDVSDANQNLLGTVNEKFSFFLSTFELVSPEGRSLAKAKLSFFATRWTLLNPMTDKPIATLSRPFISFKSKWTVKILDPVYFTEANIHPQLFYTLMAFQVDKEYWEAALRKYYKKNKGNLFSLNQSSIKDSKQALEKLATIKPLLSEIEPTEEDFIVAEALPETYGIDLEDSTETKSLVEALMSELTEDRLSESQKVALFLLLENKLIDDLKP